MPDGLAGLSDMHPATVAGDATRDCAGRLTASGEFHPALKQRLHRSIAGMHMATRLRSVWAAGVSERCITQGKGRYFWIRWVRFCGNGGFELSVRGGKITLLWVFVAQERANMEQTS